ncbi:putative bacteriophage integrase [Yersinia frederiksenii]|nr:putative bacteriophage integrase [Yersinia frederiksenii]
MAHMQRLINFTDNSALTQLQINADIAAVIIIYIGKLGEKQDTRLLSELIEIWHRAHGITFSNGKSRHQVCSICAVTLVIRTS